MADEILVYPFAVGSRYLLFFSATWCKYCTLVYPVVEGLSKVEGVPDSIAKILKAEGSGFEIREGHYKIAKTFFKAKIGDKIPLFVVVDPKEGIIDKLQSSKEEMVRTLIDDYSA